MIGWLREIQYLVEYLLLWPIVAIARSLPERQAMSFARAIGRAAYSLLSRDRRWALKNLDLVFGDGLSAEEKCRIARKSFESIVLTRVECIRWTQSWMIDRVLEEGGDDARALRHRMTKEGKGVILVTAHIGNFEMLPAWGFYGDLPSTVMYRPQNNWRVERLLLGARSAYLPNVVRRSTTGLMTLSYVLRDAGSVGLLVDMNTLDGPVFCDFLGYLAASPPGAAALALATDAPVILALAIRQTDGKHRMIFHPPFTTIRTGNKKRDIQANTQQYMKAIEGYVLAYPEQYNWPHPRWRYRPDGTFWTLEHDSAELAKEQVGGARRPLVDPTPEVLKRAQRRDPMRKAA